MTSAWFVGATGPVPQNENEARATLEPIRTSTATVEEPDSPDWNEFESDDSPELVGLSPRLKGPDTIPSEQSAPFWSKLADVNHNVIIDQQVSSSGTAAQRETAGEFGHGSMQYADSIEPVVREGGAFGNTYFASHGHEIQSESGNYMQPVNSDNWGRGVVSAEAQAGARAAQRSTLFDDFLRSTT